MTPTDPGARGSATEPPRPRPPRQAPPEPPDQVALGGGATRGIVVIGLAVLIGVGLIVVGLDEKPSNQPGFDLSALGEDEDGSTNATTADGEPAGEGDTATTATRPVAEVPVYVANGTGVGGRAQEVTDELRSAGYAGALDPGEAPQAQTTQVFYLPDWQADAEAVATALGLGPEQVAAWPDPPPFPPPFGGTVIVQLGTDLAG